MTLGFAGSGSGGFINLLTAFASGRIVAGVFCCFDMAGWIASVALGVWIWKGVHADWKQGGGSIESARREVVGIGVRQGAGIGASMSA